MKKKGLLQEYLIGVYKIANVRLSEKLIFSEYVNKGKGMVTGYQLFNNLGISDYQDDKIELYTNVITTNQKTIFEYKLKKFDIVFDDEIVDLIALLETLDIGFKMRGCYFDKYFEVVELLLPTYNDKLFERIVVAKKYKFSTVKTLSDWLTSSKIENKCLDIYAMCDK